MTVILFMGLFLTAPKLDEKLVLTPEFVIKEVLANSHSSKDINYEAGKSQLQLATAKGVYDFMFTSNLAYELSRAESISGLQNDQDKTLTLSSTLSKKIPTGTTFEARFDRTVQSSILSSVTSNFRSGSDYTSDAFTLSLRQSIIGNFFGVVDRYSVRTAENEVTRAKLNRQEDLEDLALRATSQFWKTYVAREHLNETLAAREKYSNLVKTSLDKKKVGFIDESELPKAKAEFETQEQRVKLASMDYLNQVDALFRLMNKDVDKDFTFGVPKEIPPVPKFPAPEIDSLRKVKVALITYKNAEIEKKVSDFADLPTIDIVGSSKFTGVETTPGSAFADMFSASHPVYSVELQLTYPIGSSKVSGEQTHREILFNQASNNLDKIRLDQRDLIQKTLREVKAKFSAAKSAIRSLELWEKVVKSRETSFKQGRIDINQIVLDYNALFRAYRDRAQAVGDYYISLSTLAATFDRLVESSDGKDL